MEDLILEARQEPKLCINCRHVRGPAENDPLNQYICSKARSLVTGLPNGSCGFERGLGGACGAEAKLFKPKVARCR